MNIYLALIPFYSYPFIIRIYEPAGRDASIDIMPLEESTPILSKLCTYAVPSGFSPAYVNTRVSVSSQFLVAENKERANVFAVPGSKVNTEVV